MEETKFTRKFINTFGREPTQEDISLIGHELSKTASTKYFNGKGRNEYRRFHQHTLDEVIGDHLEAIPETLGGTTLTEDEIYEIIQRKAQEEIIRKEEKREFYRNLRNKIIGELLTGAFIGTSIGAGFGVYEGTKSAVVKDYYSSKAELDNKYAEKESKLQEKFTQKETDLENRFFGPLESLTTIGEPSNFTPLETKLYAQAYLGVDFTDNLENRGNVIYDKELGNVHIVAVKIPAVRDKSVEKLMVTKMDNEGRISEVLIYKQGVFVTYPFASLNISNDSVKLVNYEDKVTRLMDKEGKVLVNENGVDSRYTDYANKVLKDFETLKGRGPDYQVKVEDQKIN